MQLRPSLPIALLTCAGPLWAQSATSPVTEEARTPGQNMPAPAVFDVELDDAYPLEGTLLASGAEGGETVQKGTASPFYLGFAGSRYVPPADERVDPKLLGEVRTAPIDGRPAPTSFAYVMFSRRITAQRTAALEALGCRVLGFHPGACLKVALPPSQIDAVAALPFVRWIGSPRTEQKVHPDLASRAAASGAGTALEMIANVYESDLCEATTRELIANGEQLDVEGRITASTDERNAAYRVHSNGWQQRALERLGLEVAYYTETNSVRAFHVRGPSAVIERLAALDFVAFVEAEPQARPFHDESMPLVHADSSRVYATGGTSLTVVGGEIDSGISAGHSDLYYHLNGWGWDFSGSGTGAWYDACGHGTHVCGTITGDGTSNSALRGVAPGLGWGATGRFQQSKIFASCASQSVNLAGVMGAMRGGSWDGGGSYTPRAHVINNSWGSDPTPGGWIGSEYNSRLVDDEVYWQRQLYVFAAGNDASASTLSQEATAKNAFTVGSVDDYVGWGSFPGNRSAFSSQGPAGDSRWKPNVCAPGDWIRSLAANTWNGYTNLAGTSMAAPHVTGIAAQLADNYWWMRYEPQRMAANLMGSAVTRGAAPIYDHYNGDLDRYGAGRVDAYLANWGTSQTGWQNWGFDLGAGQGTYADIYVAPGTTRVVVCMTWHEWASSAGASQAAINDWDLYIDQEPFAPGTNTGEFSGGLSSYDNTEIRYLDYPAAGNYRWKIHPYNATTTGHFSVMVYYVSGPLAPTVDLSLSQSSYYVVPGQPLVVSASLYNPGFLASAAYVSSSGGSYLNNAYKYLNDGAFAPMTGNVAGGQSITLGNVLSYNSRNAYFEPVWWSEGWQSFTVQATHDNGGGDWEIVYVGVDGTPPTPVGSLASTSHVPGQWSCNPTIDVSWLASTDAVAGVLGYSYEVDQSASTDPDGWVDTYGLNASFAVADSFSPYYVHVRAVDYSGLAGATEQAGPFYVYASGPYPYCVGKINTQFCLPYMGTYGSISSGSDDLHLTAADLINQKTGLVFWGTASSSVPFQGGTKCVASPVIRSPILSSGGSPTGSDCTGTFDYAFTRAYAQSYGITDGTWLYAQVWYRDPPDPFHTGLTDAVAFLMCE